MGPSGSGLDVSNTKTDGSRLSARGIGAGNQSGIDINNPPYAIHNGMCVLFPFKPAISASRADSGFIAGNGRLAVSTVSPNATHFGGYAGLDVHSMWGLMEAEATHKALQAVLPGQRPFIISRSTFASAGKWTGHWVSMAILATLKFLSF